jgi:uncharacterized membrane protein
MIIHGWLLFRPVLPPIPGVQHYEAMLRSQDILFGILGLVLIGLVALRIEVAVMALVGAFACGAFYVLKGMIPSKEESFGIRVFTSVFLSVVLASLVLILPGTFGAHALGRNAQKTVIEVAGALPLIAICFEVLRTPRVIRGILRYFGYR